MKNLRLLVFLGLVVSCTPNISSTIPSVKPTISTTPTSVVTSNPSINALPIVSVSPSIPIVDTTPLPTPSTDFKSLKVKEIKIYYENSLIAIKDYKTNRSDSITYNILSGETKNFSAEIIYENGFINRNVIWTSNNLSSISVDSYGVIRPESTYGSSYVSVNDGAHSGFGITVNYLMNLNFTQEVVENCRMKEIIVERPRFEYYQVESTINVKKILSYKINDHIEGATFMGIIYNPSGIPIEGATVNAVSIDPGVNWIGQEQITNKGCYMFRNAPVGARIVITVTKDGWTSRTRSEVLKSNLQGDPTVNVFDFAGIYAFQDEPEITTLKVNGRMVNGSSNSDVVQIISNTPKNTKPSSANLDNGAQLANNIGNVPSLTGVNTNSVEVEMTFSEPINVDDIKNYFRLTSQSGFDNRATSFTVDSNYSIVEFVVSGDERVVTFKTNKAVLANRGGEEARYLIDFSQAFRDKTDKSAIDRRYFRFSPSQINDFAVFSVKNDEEAPKLLNIVARDGGSANDTIELRYSEPMELINQTAYPTGLADHNEPLNMSRQLWYKDANSVKSDIASITNSIDDNNATLIGYLNGSDSDVNQFKTSYMIGRVLEKDITNGTPKMVTLGTLGRAAVTTPVKGNTTANDLLRNVRITGNNILLEFSPTAFDRDDRVVVAVSKRIEGNYVDRNRTPSINEELTVNVNPTVDYVGIYDPAGRLINTGNSSTSANIDVTNAQRATTVI